MPTRDEWLKLGAPPLDLAQWGIGGAVPVPLDADRWAEERQYLRNDTGRGEFRTARGTS